MPPEQCSAMDWRTFCTCAGRAIAAAGLAVAENPTLVIHMGAATAESMAQAMGSRPPGAVLLYVAAGNSAPIPPATERGAAACLVVPFDSVSALSNRVGLLVSLLQVRRIHLRIDSAQATVFEAARQAVAEMIGVVLDNSQQDRNRGLIRLRSSLANLPSILAQGGSLPPPLPAGARVVICGAGPSLGEHFEALRRYRDRLVIVAVGHSVAPLVAAGIEPDAVVEVDAHAGPNWPHGLRPGALLVACTEVAPSVAGRFRDIVWCAGSSPVFNAAMRRHGVPLLELNLGCSVTVTAIDFALRMGGRRLALIGQDFCLAPDGRSHADGECIAEGDERIRVPASGGGTVLTTRNFDHLRQAMERFVREVVDRCRAGADPIVNCTPGGARIEGLRSVLFETFCEEAEPGAGRWVGALGVRRVVAPVAGLSDERDALLDYARRSDAALETAGGLRDALRVDPLPMERIRTMQALLQGRITDLLQCERAVAAAHWLLPAVTLVERIFSESPSGSLGGQDPVAALDMIEARHAFAGDLARELAGDLEPSLCVAGATCREPRPLESTAFRNHGLACLRRMGGSLCGRLERGVLPVPDGLRLRWFNQYLPWVRVVQDGREVALTAMTGMLDEARREVDRYAAGCGVLSRSAVVFAGSGGWTHIGEWARRFPERPVAVLEPWPGVLAELLSHGCFLHLLPAGSRVIDASAGADWGQELFAWCERVRGEGLSPVVFPHPRGGVIPLFAALEEAASGVCAGRLTATLEVRP